nr:hypothetical protein [Tanacetum cinerariifolium]
MARLAFCDYHNMITILEKSEHNVDFHQIVDFVEASHIRYALTINPTVYVSHIRQFWSTARIKTTNEGTNILATVDGKPRTIFESSIMRNLKLNDEEGISTLLDAELFENLALMGYNILPNQKFTFQKGFNEFSSIIATAVGEGSGTPTEPRHTPSPQAQQSPHHDLSSSHPIALTEAIPTTTPIEIPILRQYFRRATRIAQSKALPTAADEPASLLRDDSQGEAFPIVSGLEAGQDRENIIKTSALPHDLTPRVTSFDADEGNDAPIKGRSLETGEEAGVERSTERGTASVPPVDEVSTVSVPTGSGLVPTVSAIFTTASVVTPYSRRPREISAKDKGKEKMVESDTPKKKKFKEQIDVQMAREMEEQMAREDQRIDEQIARDAKIVRIHAEEELQMLIDGLDRNNEVIAKHLQEYEQSKADLTIGEKIDLINELVKYQDHHEKILKGMTLEEIREKFIAVWKQIEDFMPMASKEEGERVKRKGLKLEQGSAKKIKISEDVSEEYLKEMMQLVPVEEVYVEALQVKHPIIDWDIYTEGKRDYWKIIRLGGHTTVYQFFVDMLKQLDREDLNQLWTLVKETLNIRQDLSDKEKELWVELKRLFEPDFEDHLWTHIQALMHDSVEWRLYDTCGVHHVFTRDQEIFMLVERDYQLRRGLAIVMIRNL